MKQFYGNKWFWTASVLALILMGRALSFALAQSGAGWQPPTGPPPFGQPAAPLDVSGSDQSKEGKLSVRRLNSTDYVFVGDELGGNGIRLHGSTGRILFDRTGLGSPGMAAIALRSDENGNWVLQATHNSLSADGGWFTLGSGGGTTGGGVFWRATVAGTPGVVHDGRVGIGTGAQNLVSMLHVKAASATSPATQGLTIQGPQDAFQSQYAARLFMQGTDFRILRTTQSVDDGLTIRADGSLVAGRGLQVKGDSTFDGAVKMTNITQLNNSVERALTLDANGNVRLATVSGAGGGGSIGPCTVVDLYYFEETRTMPQSVGKDVSVTYVSHVGVGAGSGGTFIGSFCAGPTPDERFDQQQRYENLRSVRERAIQALDAAAAGGPQPWTVVKDWINALDEYGVRSPVYRQNP
ncbi:MAG: hypothetical protein O3A46_10340 [Candidatus Poribacteria bacterium]|nr:hypothetical protein [Candidatus Poribacteria bacterium]